MVVGFSLAVLLPSQKLKAQSVVAFNKKAYYATIFDKSAIEKIKNIDEKEIDYLSKVRVFETKRKDLTTLYLQAKDASSKNKILSKLTRVERRLQRKKNCGYKRCAKINQEKQQIYKDFLTKESNTKLNQSNKADIERLKDSATSLLAEASGIRTIAPNFDRKGKSEKLEAAYNKEKLALSKYEKAFGILNQDPDFKPKVFGGEIKSMGTTVDVGSSKPTILIDNNKGQVSQSTVVTSDQINQYLGTTKSNLDPKNTNFTIADSSLHKNLNLTPLQKKSLAQSAKTYDDAQELFKKVDASYAKIDELKKQARAVADKDKKESIRLKSEAEEMERLAFIDLNKAINMQLSSNEAKHQLYRQILDKQKPSSGITEDEGKRAKQLVGEANQYHNLSVARQKKAASQSFVSEKYTMLIEANELLQECVRREQNAIALNLDLVNLTAQDKKMLEVYDEEKNDQLLRQTSTNIKTNEGKQNTKKKKSSNPNVHKVVSTDEGTASDSKIEGVSIFKISKISGLFYTVQLGVFKTEITKEEAAGLSPLVEASTPKGKRYTYGIFTNEADAKKALAKAKSAGYDKAYITAYYNKENIQLSKGRQLAKEGVSFAKVPATNSTGKFIVLVGSYSKSLSDEDFDLKYGKLNSKYKVSKTERNNKYNYSIGSFSDKVEAKEAEAYAKSLGIDAYIQGSSSVNAKNTATSNEPKKDEEKKEEHKLVPQKFVGTTYKVKLGAYSTALSDEDFKAKYGKFAEVYKVESAKDPDTKLTHYYVANLQSKSAADQVKKKASELGIESYIVVGASQVKLEKKATKVSKTKKVVASKDNKKDSVHVEKEQILKDVSYKLQIGEFASKLSDDELNAKYKDVLKYCRISTYNDKKTNKVLYLVGEFKGYDDAIVEKDNLRKKGVFGTVIAFSGDVKVSLFQARKSEQSSKN